MVRRTRQLFDIDQVHINVLEFIVVLLQLAAAITRERESFQVANQNPICPLHKLLISRSDNSPSYNWAHKVSAKSERGQLFVSIYAKLLDQTHLTVDCTHVAGIDNHLVDLYHVRRLFLSLTKPVVNRYSRRSRDCVPISFSGLIQSYYPV